MDDEAHERMQEKMSAELAAMRAQLTIAQRRAEEAEGVAHEKNEAGSLLSPRVLYT